MEDKMRRWSNVLPIFFIGVLPTKVTTYKDAKKQQQTVVK